MRPHTMTGPHSSTQVTRTGKRGSYHSSIRWLIRVGWRWFLVCRWDRIARLLLDPGDTLLVEEWAYVSAMAAARPIDLRWHAVPMDSQGMRADALREILAGWNVEKNGRRYAPSYVVGSSSHVKRYVDSKATSDLHRARGTESVRDCMCNRPSANVGLILAPDDGIRTQKGHLRYLC